MTRHTHDESQDAGGRRGRPGPVDPELVDDLGAEFELRGDVLEDALEAARRRGRGDGATRRCARRPSSRTSASASTREREDERKRATRAPRRGAAPGDRQSRARDRAHLGGRRSRASARPASTSVHAQIVGVLGKEGVERHRPVRRSRSTRRRSRRSASRRTRGARRHGRRGVPEGLRDGRARLRPAMVVVSTGGPRREE